jgi:8-oxo-dGTP pyrophosphatase MutT (NUDIX family)
MEPETLKASKPTTAQESHLTNTDPVGEIVDRSYGIIALRLDASSHMTRHSNAITPQPSNTKVLLIQQRRIAPDAQSSGHLTWWTVPKGHAEAEETPHQAAIRELREETNLQVSESDLLFPDEQITESYPMTNGTAGLKAVDYWTAVVDDEQEVVVQDAEVLAYRWVEWAEAIRIVRDSSKPVLRKALDQLA